ncbi:LysM domain-containing protein [Oscillospiraceae bacterium WX1]
MYTIRPGDTLWQIARKFSTDINTIMYYNQGTDLSMIYIDQVICIPAGDLTGAYGGDEPISKAMLDLNNIIRMLWEQHVYWTRLFIVSTVFALPDGEMVTNRLLRNPKDFAAALTPLYGNAAASQFERLLTDHLTIAAALVSAAKRGDGAAAADAEKRWYQNADDIASFLAGINPFWSTDQWRKLLYDHLAMTKKEAVDFLQQDFTESITTFDAIEKEALEMADVMTSGIIKQFPDLF